MDRFATEIRHEFPIEYHLQIDAWSENSHGNDQVELAGHMKKFYEAIKFQNIFVNTPSIAEAIALAVSAGPALIVGVCKHGLLYNLRIN